MLDRHHWSVKYTEVDATYHEKAARCHRCGESKNVVELHDLGSFSEAPHYGQVSQSGVFCSHCGYREVHSESVDPFMNS